MFCRAVAFFALSLTAWADFSYTTTQKATGGSMGAMAGAAADRITKYYFKGQKMMTSSSDSSTIIDFGTQTVTTFNNAQKTYTVKKFSDIAGAGMNLDVSADVKETGQKKTVNGFNASEMTVTMNTDMDAGRGGTPMQMQMNLDMWVSADVTGAGEMRAFFRKNAANFPWAAMMGGGGNQSMQKAMAQVQRKLADLDGAVVEQVIKIKPGGGTQAPQMPQIPQMTAEQQAQIQAAMAKMSPAQQAQMQAAMGAMGRGGTSPGASQGSGALIEMTVDSSGFSTASVPDSVFAIPAGYSQKQ